MNLAPRSPMTPLIEVDDLHFEYDDGTPALAGVSFRLAPGECVALLGANGSGKTTFVLHLNGILSGRGRISVCGMNVEKQNLPEIRKRIGMVFQDSDEQLFMPTVFEDVTFGPLNLGLPPAEAQERARAALEQVGMGGVVSKAPYHLSAGEKRRVSIAGVLAMDPEILILDEPTTYLDPPAERELVALLHQLPQAKIIITHDIPFARVLASRAVFFERGRIAASGTVAEVVSRYDWEPHL
jgi:cobalt/nickel transport system ATP-binding protein